MKLTIGIVSDTHGLLRPEVFDLFDGVDHILHAGDVGSPDLLVELESIAPVTAVWGNTDGWDLHERVPEIARVTLAGVAVVVVHGQQFGSPSPKAVADAYPDAGLVVFGHTHVPLIERVGTILAVNPGSAGPKRFGHPIGVALATIQEGRIEARLVPLAG